MSTVNRGDNELVSYRYQHRYITDSIRKGYKVMIVMRGLPGSGKTYLATKLLESGLGVVKQDEFIFRTNEYSIVTDSSNRVFENSGQGYQLCQESVYSSAKRGVSPIIIDDTNLMIPKMMPYFSIGVYHGYMMEIIEMSTPWALSLKILASKNVHDVNESTLTSMLNIYERQGLTAGQFLQSLKLSYTEHIPSYRQYPPLPAPPKQPTATLKANYANPSHNSFKPLTALCKAQATSATASTSSSFSALEENKVMKGSQKDGTRANGRFPSLIEDIPVAKQLRQETKKMSSEVIYEAMSSSDQFGVIKEMILKQSEEMKELRDEVVNKVTVISDQLEVMKKMALKQSEEMQELRGEVMNKVIVISDQLEVMKKMVLKQSEEMNELRSEVMNKVPVISDQLEVMKEIMLKQSEEMKDMRNKIISLLSQRNENARLHSSIKQLMFTTADSKIEVMALHKQLGEIKEMLNKTMGLPSQQNDDIKLLSSVNGSALSNTAAIETKDKVCTVSSRRLVESWSTTAAILEQAKPNQSNSCEVVMLDKDNMTDKAEPLLKMNMDERDQVAEVMQLFPDIAAERISDIYEKCQKDFHWTVDIISDLPAEPPV